MQFKKVLAITFVSSVLALQSANAQSLRQDGTPAEFPPSSYSGKQYVDSRGCVFIRAGVDGAVSWVPRVARDRKLVCGFQPTFANAQPTPEAAPSTNVVQIVPDPAPAQTTVAAKPAVKKAPVANTTTRVAAAKPAPVKRVVRAAPTPTPVAVAPAPVKTVKTVAPQPQQTARVANQCSGLSEKSRKYLQHPSAKVRCHSQTVSPLQTAAATGTPTTVYAAPAATATTVAAVPAKRGQIVTAGQVPATTRVVPRHVYEQRANVPRVHQPPKGYKWIWEDGRLNHHRAEQTFEGMAQTDAIWTKTVPRRLKTVPATDYYVGAQATQTQGVKTIVSTKNTPANKTVVVGQGSYVQVAAYKTSQDAQTVARRVRALGMPTKVGRLTRGSETYRLVLAGPFADSAAAQSALNKARSAGYANATLR